MRAQHRERGLHLTLSEAIDAAQAVVKHLKVVKLLIAQMEARLQAHRQGPAELSPDGLRELAFDVEELAETAVGVNQIVLVMIGETSAGIRRAFDLLQRRFGEHEGNADLAAALVDTLSALEADYRALRQNERLVVLHMETLLALTARQDSECETTHAVKDLMHRLKRRHPTC